MRRAAAVKAEAQMLVVKSRTLDSLRADEPAAGPTPTPRPPTASAARCLLLALPDEVQLSIAHRLCARDLLCLASTCGAARRMHREHHAALWRRLLARDGVALTGAAAQSEASTSPQSLDNRCLDFRALHALLCEARGGRRQLEVQGVNYEVSIGEMRAWWRCVAVAIDVRPPPEPPELQQPSNESGAIAAADLPQIDEQREESGAAAAAEGSGAVAAAAAAMSRVMVSVRWYGYTAKDDEWRPLDCLRPFSPAEAHAGWRRERRQPGDLLEVSWAIHGHPAARWEAVVLDVNGEMNGHPRGPSHDWIWVHFEDFSNDWDEWLGASSRRLMPRRGDCCYAQEDVWRSAT